jgi:hypothetical protein
MCALGRGGLNQWRWMGGAEAIPELRRALPIPFYEGAVGSCLAGLTHELLDWVCRKRLYIYELINKEKENGARMP